MENWLAVFPREESADAVDAIFKSWHELVSMRRANFHHKVREPNLTKQIKEYVETKVSVDQGLMGHWVAESVHNIIDSHTGDIVAEGRTDITYFWNNEDVRLMLVFEFKKLGNTSASRTNYLGAKGLDRFVNGTYSVNQPVAVMVAIHWEPVHDVVSGLCRALKWERTIKRLKTIKAQDGDVVRRPSILFPQLAEFDTLHQRAPDKTPSHGEIRVAHMFLGF